MAWIRPVLLICFIFLFRIAAFGQENLLSTPIDSLLEKSDSEKVETPEIAKPSLEGSIKKAQNYTLVLNRMNQTLKNELDTNGVNDYLPNAQLILTKISETLSPENTRVNLRYLTALENILGHNLRNLEKVNEEVLVRIGVLVGVKEKLDSIKRDDVFQYNLRDTTILPEYQIGLKSLKSNVSATDSILNIQRLTVLGLQSRLATTINEIKLREEDLRQTKVKLEKSLLEKESNYLWQPSELGISNQLTRISSEALRINGWIINNYLQRNLPLSVILVLAVGFLFRYIRGNLARIKTEKEFSSIILGRLKYLYKYPFLSSLLVILAIAPFFYPYPPAAFYALMLFFLVTVAVIILYRRLSSKTYRLILLMYILFFLNTLSNLYWQVAFQERWYLIIFNFAGVFLGWMMLKSQSDGKENLPSYFGKIILTYMGLELASFVANVFGRFSLSKLIGVAGTISLMHAVSLIIFVVIIKEIIYIQLEVSKKTSEGFTSAIDFYDIQKKINRFFTILAIAIWGYYFLESMLLLDTFLNEVFDFLDKQRKILNATFTFSQIGVFFLVIYTSTFLANSIAYIASIKDERQASQGNTRLGSSILLIRLAILSLGFFVAVASSGIPIDKIAIVLGALSVGIGFGLQTIVNNLVSGIILAFERPIQIGDIVEVGTIEGVVKDIGIRASKIRIWDGAEVIIPNGDLLANHLTNWTLADKSRRVELTIGVAYNSDPELVTELIQKQLDIDNILKMPLSRVFLQTFDDNSVNFRVLFWVDDIDVWVIIRDQVMRGIFKSFQENGIEIPFPQRDIYIKNFPGIIEEKVVSAAKAKKSVEPKTDSEESK